MNFNYFDYIGFAFIIFSSLLGLARGFWLQVITFGTWLGAAVVYYFFGPNIAEHLVSNGMSTEMSNWIVLGGIFLTFFFFGFVLRLFASTLLGVNTFTFFNKMMGLLLGFFVSIVVISFAVYAVNHTNYSSNQDWKKSVLVTRMSSVTNNFNGFKGFNEVGNARNSFTNTSISKEEYAKELA